MTRQRLSELELGVMSTAVCFKHDSGVCACAETALILLPVVNLSLEMDSAVTSISYMTWKFLPSEAAFRLFWRFSFHCACAALTILLRVLPVYNLTSCLNSAQPFSYKDAVISGARNHFRRLLWRMAIMSAHAQLVRVQRYRSAGKMRTNNTIESSSSSSSYKFIATKRNAKSNVYSQKSATRLLL